VIEPFARQAVQVRQAWPTQPDTLLRRLRLFMTEPSFHSDAAYPNRGTMGGFVISRIL